jgi:hypothetical protein
MKLARYHSLLLILVLIVTRVAVLEHEVDVKAHQPGDHCEFCLHAAALDHAGGGTAGIGLIADVARTVFLPLLIIFVSTSVYALRARGPPASLQIA